MKVDTDLLQQMAAYLGDIADRLDSAGAQARVDRGVMGHGGLAAAMDHFVGNWRVHRERLVSAVRAHQKMAGQSAQAYVKLDQDLADGLDPGRSGTSAGGAPSGGGGR